MKKPSDPELWILIAAVVAICLFVGLGTLGVWLASGG